MGNLDQDPYQWMTDLFVDENCAECHGDENDHNAIPFMGNWFAQCKPKMAYSGDGQGGVATRWFWQTGDSWMAVNAGESEAEWFADCEADGTPMPTPRVLPIDEWPDHGRVVYRLASGREVEMDV